MSIQRKMAGLISKCLLIMSLLASGPAQAGVITSTVLDVLLHGGQRALINLVFGVLTGERGATTAAKAKNDGGDGHIATSSWFGTADPLSASSTDSDGNFGFAEARNSLRGKVAEAFVAGEATARAELLWNNVVEWEAEPPTTSLTKATANLLPDLIDVESATLKFTYTIEETKVDIGSGGNGSFALEVKWNDVVTLSGMAEYMDDGAVSLSGDLSGAGVDFGSTDFAIAADDVDISHNVEIPVNYGDFIANGGVSTTVSGSMIAIASGIGSGGGGDDVPEPETLALVALGIVGLFVARRRRPQRHDPRR